MSTDAFLPDNYEPPSSGGGYTKLELGDNKLRLLSSPLMMWSCWTDGKVKRLPYAQDNKPAKGSGQKDSVKHAWGLVVFNYQTKAIEVLELDKQDIIAGLTTHANDPDWGHPKHYDVVINKSGSGMDTEYKLVCKPKTEPSQEIVDAFVENPIDLNQLLVENGNPFLNNAGSPANTEPAAEAAKVVTPENWVEGDAVPDGYKVEDGKLVKKELPF